MISIGVVFMASQAPERLRGIASCADEAGLDELWLWEDCFKYGGIASAAAALAWTGRLRVAAGLLPVPLRNVALTAMELSTLHRMFPGRLLCGIGHGVQDWMDQSGARVDSPLTLLGEYASALKALLSGDTVTTTGRYVRLNAVRLDWPLTPRPKLFMGGVGARTIRLAGEVADGTILSAVTTREQVEQVRNSLPAGHILSVAIDAGALPREPEELAAAIRHRAEAGADRVILEPAHNDPDPEGFIRLVASMVQPLVQ